MNAVLFGKCGKIKFPKINIRDFLKRTDECQDALKEKIDEIEKATMNGEDTWMIKEKK